MSENAAASYARSAVYDEDSIKAQHQANRNTATEKDIPVIREYQDNGVSGLSSDRPGFQEMMADALSEEKLFDTIIVQDVAKLSRNPSDFILYPKQLEEAGVSLLIATETERP